MGNGISKEEVKKYVETTKFTENEVKELLREFHRVAGPHKSITREEFISIISPFVHTGTTGRFFLERLFAAFDKDRSGSIDKDEFFQGLNVFMRGAPEEKQLLSFRIYDIDGDEYITRKELTKNITKIYNTLYNDDQSDKVKAMVKRIFEDIDENGDEQLSLPEYKLMCLREPIIIDLLEQFLALE